MKILQMASSKLYFFWRTLCFGKYVILVCLRLSTRNSLFARLGTDYEIRNQWFFAILEAMTTD